MRTLGQSIHYDPDRIIPTLCLRKFGNHIHGDLLPLPYWYLQRLQFTMRSLMLGLEFSTSQAFLYILSHIKLHSWPPVVFSQVPIHLSGTRMYRELGLMSLI